MVMKKIIIGFSLGIMIFLAAFISNLVFPFIEAVNSAISGETGHILGFFGIFIVLLIIQALIAYSLLKKKGIAEEVLANGKDNVATSKFAKEGEFKGITGTDGLPISKNFRLSEKKSFEHYLLVGPTGSGKSASYFIPSLLNLPSSASVVVTDPKGELYMKTAQHALNQGKNVIAFSPFKSKTMKYNPLALCRSASEVRELAQVLLANGNAAIEQMTGTKSGGSEWTNMATPLLVAFMLFVYELEAPDNTVAKALELITENDLETLKLLIEDSTPEAQQQMNIFLQSAESEKTASSIKTVLATSLQMFTDPLIQEITSLNEIDPKKLREEPTHLYVMVPEHKSAFMSPLMSPFYSQLMNHLLETGKGCPIYFLMDEFANIGVIPNIDIILAICRSRDMSISLGIQSTNQLKQRYNEAANTILDNLKTKAFLPGLSYDSADYASKLMGFKEIKSVSTSFSKSNDNSYSVSAQKRELMTPDEIRRLPDETILIISDNRNAFMDKQNRYYKDKRMLALTSQELTVEEMLGDDE